MTELKPYRVLSLDGGGTRGLYTAVLLEGITRRIARQNGIPDDKLDVGKHFDLIVGTSTGAIIAAALAAGASLDQVIRLYREQATAIFRDPTPASTLALIPWLVRNALLPANDANPLREAMTGILGSETLGQVYARRGVALCIPAINASTRKSWVFKTPHDTRNHRLQRDNDITLVDACMASAAAPIVFPLQEICYRTEPGSPVRWFTDGGLYANNPVVLALVEALAFAPKDAPIEILSVSTCPPVTSEPVTSASARPGLISWIRGLRIIETSLDAQAFAHHNTARFLAAELDRRITYIRLDDPPLSVEDMRKLRLDNPAADCLDRLVELAHDAIDRNISLATAGTQDLQPLVPLLSNIPTRS